MASTTGAHKRPRPAFSPPRPGKSKLNSTTNVTKKTGADRVKKSTATNSASATNGRRAGGKSNAVSTAQKMQTQKKQQQQKQRRRAAAGTMRAILDEASDEDEDEDETVEERNEDEDEDDGSDDDPREEASSDPGEEEQEEDETRLSNHAHGDMESQASSPEPEFILAEIIQHDDHRGKKSLKSTNPSDSESPIPLPLIHHIMQSQFANPDKTSLSKDALSLLGKYVEAFIREGIHRCALDRAEREKAGGGTGDASDSGWLEVEDLERVAVQLCLDF